ncbi:hypothetical protein RUM44_006331 [Polyplax serrata]|uniref:Carboxylesterase type B domain-containing protein n=1 Tax=Polyplax serrata TaxID=468196 RepID=A0ABR1AHT4_POLSC
MFLFSLFLHIEDNNVRCAKNAREQPTVNIPGQGVVSGREVVISRAKSFQYLGLPYAQPPTGNLRFAPPNTELPTWKDVRNASEFAPACLQSKTQFQGQDRLFGGVLPEVQFSEDCLYLNVFLPDGAKPSDGWPVMLWFHPGNLSSGASLLWDGSILALRQKVIVVTAAYRLNIFGFFSTNDPVAPGNYGLLDQVAAMDWVMSKISAFGGSPNNVVLCGHGASGMSVGLHLLSPLSRGKFHRAIAMSPKGIINRSIKTHGQMDLYKFELAEIFACATKSSLLVACLRRLPGEYILEHASHLVDAFGPIVDVDYANDSKPFLPHDPEELVRDGEFVKVPLLIGYTHMEDALDLLETNENLDHGMSWDDLNMFVSEAVETDILNFNVNDSCIEELASLHLKDTVLFYYTPRPLTNDLTVLRDKFIEFLTEKLYGSGTYLLASSLTQAKVDAYVYRFDYKIKTDNVVKLPKGTQRLPNWITASHQLDLPFIWGMPYWTQIKRNVTWNSADKKMADIMLTLWGNFVKYGNPTHSNINLKWEVFRENISGIMILDRNSNVSDVSNFDYKAFEFWNNYYPKVWNILLQGCNMTSGGFQTNTPVIPTHGYLLLISFFTYIVSFMTNLYSNY